jgi:hypothetical protein
VFGPRVTVCDNDEVVVVTMTWYDIVRQSGEVSQSFESDNSVISVKYIIRIYYTHARQLENGGKGGGGVGESNFGKGKGRSSRHRVQRRQWGMTGVARSLGDLFAL